MVEGTVSFIGLGIGIGAGVISVMSGEPLPLTVGPVTGYGFEIGGIGWLAGSAVQSHFPAVWRQPRLNKPRANKADKMAARRIGSSIHGRGNRANRDPRLTQLGEDNQGPR